MTLYRTIQSPFHAFVMHKSPPVSMDRVLDDTLIEGDASVLSRSRLCSILQGVSETGDGSGWGRR